MCRVRLTPTAAKIFNRLHPDIKKTAQINTQRVYDTPHTEKVLQDKLIDFRSLKMKLYRAVYQIDDRNKTIIIYTNGHCRDIYCCMDLWNHSEKNYFGVVPPSI